MLLQVFSLSGVKYDGEAISVNAKTTSGEITVLDHHRPLITILKKGSLVVTDKNGSKKTIPTPSGFLEVSTANKSFALIS